MRELQILILQTLKENENGLTFEELCGIISESFSHEIAVQAALFDLIRTEEIVIINQKYHGTII